MSRSLAAALAATEVMFLPNLALAVWPLFFLPGLVCDLGSGGREGIA